MRSLAYRPSNPFLPTDAWSSQCPSIRILCFKHRRKVSRDNTIKYNRRTLQLLPCRTRPTYAGVHRFVEIAASNATMPRTTACGNAGTVTLTGLFMAGTQ